MTSTRQQRRASRGAHMTEYVMVFGVVLGAVFAMGPYIKDRLSGSIQNAADQYSTTAGGGTYRPDQVAQSESENTIALNDAYTGEIRSETEGRQIHRYDDDQGGGGP